MRDNRIIERVHWLWAQVDVKRKSVSGLMARLSAVSAHADNTMLLHKKFIRILDQISDEKSKEMVFLRKIETLEKRHHELRKRALLKRAALVEKRKGQQREEQNDKHLRKNEDEQSRTTGLLVALYLALYTRFPLFNK